MVQTIEYCGCGRDHFGAEGEKGDLKLSGKKDHSRVTSGEFLGKQIVVAKDTEEESRAVNLSGLRTEEQ